MKSVLDRSGELGPDIQMADKDGKGKMFSVARETHYGFGVVCLDEHKRSDPTLNELVDCSGTKRRDSITGRSGTDCRHYVLTKENEIKQ